MNRRILLALLSILSLCVGCGDDVEDTPNPACAGLLSALSAFLADASLEVQAFDAAACNAADTEMVESAAVCVRDLDCRFFSAQDLEACVRGI